MAKARNSRVKSAIFVAALLGSALGQARPGGSYYYGNVETNTTYSSQRDMLLQETKSQIQDYLPASDPSYRQRLESHIFTDKVVYRPNDVIFTEVLVVDAFNKTPVGTTTADYYNYYLSFIILDPSGSEVYSSYGYAQNGTAAFTYKVPSDVVGGDYILTVGNSYQIAPASKLVRIADYPRDQLQLIATLPQDSYNPGDTVTGQLVASTMDGSPFNSTPSYSLQVSFDTEEGDATA